MSPRFEFEKDAIKSLLRILSNGVSCRIDPIEIQIICRHIENNIYDKSLKKTLLSNELIVSKQKLPSIKDVITTFYYSCWSEVKKSFPCKVIISELVLDEKKIQVFEGYFLIEGIEILENLAATGLLRKIHIGKDNYYQLSHDRLIKPLVEDLAKLQANEEAEKKAEEARIEAERKAEKARIEAEEEKIRLQNEVGEAEKRNKANAEIAKAKRTH